MSSAKPEVELVSDVRLLHRGDSASSDQMLPLKMVSTGDTVEQIKVRIEKDYGFSTAHQQLLYNGDIMDDEEPLTHYGVKTNTFNYALFELRLLDEPLPKKGKGKEEPSGGEKSLWQKAKNMTMKSGSRKDELYIPKKLDERLWIPVAGILPIKPPVRRSMAAGTKGVLRFMDEYKGHAGVQQECCFGIITLAELTEEGVIFKKRLFDEGVIPRVATALARYKSHLGVQKQGLGVFHYMICDNNMECVDSIVNRKGHQLACAAAQLASSTMMKIPAEDRKESTGMTCGDIIETSAGILRQICSMSNRAHVETSGSGGQAIFSSALKDVDGLLQKDSVVQEVEMFLKVIKGKPPKAAKGKKSK